MSYQIEERQKRYAVYHQGADGYTVVDEVWGDDFRDQTVAHLESKNRNVIKVVERTIDEQSLIHRALTTCPKCGCDNIETDGERYCAGLTLFHSQLFCTSCDFEYTVVYQIKSIQRRV